MFWIAPEPATTVWTTDPSCHTHAHSGKVFSATVNIHRHGAAGSVCVSFTAARFHLPAVFTCALLCVCVFLTRRDQMFMRPPTPPDARAQPSGLKASVRTGVMCPFSWKTHAAPSSDQQEDCNT